MFNLKNAIWGASLAFCLTGVHAEANPGQRFVGGEFVIEGEPCGEMKWYWPDKNVRNPDGSPSGFSWEVTGCDALAELMQNGPPSTPEPTPVPTPTPVVDPGDCPPGAQWLDQPNSIGGFGFDSVRFQPNETKYFCMRLAEEKGNAWKLNMGASGWSNDSACEALTMKLVSWPSSSTADPRLFESGPSRSPKIWIASHSRFDTTVSMEGPPGLYVMTATENKGVRASGEEVCRHYRIAATLEYPDLD